MSFESLLKGIVRTGISAATGAKKAVEQALAEARAAEAEAKRKAAEAEAARRAAVARREREEAEAEARRKAAERARREAARQKREASLVAAVLATTEALGIASAKPPTKTTGGKRTAAKASSKKGEAGNAPAKKAASKATRTIARENAALAARPDPEAKPYETAEPNRDYAKAQGNFNASSGLAFIRSQILRIVNMEGPISEPMLLVRVLDEWGFSDLDKLRYRIFRMAVPGVLPVSDRLGIPVYWPVGVGPGDWNCYRFPSDANRPQRVFATIPLEEIAAAIVAEHHASSGDRPIDDYVPGALERLGLPRGVSPDMGEALEVAKLLAQGIDDRPSANISIPDEWNEAAAQAEEAERRRKEAEEAERRKKEAEEAERRRKEADRRKKEAERRRKEAEEIEERERTAASLRAARLAEQPEETELDATPEDEIDDETTVHYDDAAAARAIAALGSASFWNAFAAQQKSESDDDGGDPPPPED